MKRLLISIVLAGGLTALVGCCNTGGCGAYTTTYVAPVVSTCSTCGVRPVCSTCATNTCSTCGYGFGYNDWY